jgi:hypothetical protein
MRLLIALALLAGVQPVVAMTTLSVVVTGNQAVLS